MCKMNLSEYRLPLRALSHSNSSNKHGRKKACNANNIEKSTEYSCHFQLFGAFEFHSKQQNEFIGQFSNVELENRESEKGKAISNMHAS